MTDETFGIVVATSGRPALLRQALMSIHVAASAAEVAGATCEIVVVDDGSPGSATREVCDAMGVRCLRLDRVDHDRTPAAARRAGLDEIDTEFACFFDDDDVMLPWFVVAHLDALRAGADVVSSSYYLSDQQMTPGRLIRAVQPRLGDLVADRNTVNDFAAFRRASCDHAFTGARGRLTEYAAWMQLAFEGKQMQAIRTPTFLYRLHGANISLGAPSDVEFQARRAALVSEYRQMVRTRDGRLPPTSMRFRLSSWTPTWLRRRMARALGRVARK